MPPAISEVRETALSAYREVVPRLVHDRITLLLYAQLGVWGFFLYGFGPVVPLLRDEQGVSAALASLHGTGLAVGILIAGVDLLAGLPADRPRRHDLGRA